MDDIHKKIIDYYNNTQLLYELIWFTIGGYPSMHYGFWGTNTKRLKDAINNENITAATYLQLDKSDIVLDAGCGVGGTSIWIAKNYGCKIYGITICENQVKRANKYIKHYNVDHLITIELKDFCNTGYLNESFSKILGIESICYAPNKADFIREAYRLLKPKGRLVIIDGVKKTEKMTPREKKLLEDFIDGWAIPNLATTDEYFKYLKEAGFIDINIEDFTEQSLPSAYRIWWFNLPFLIPFKIMSTLNIIPYISYKDIVASLNQYILLKERIAKYVIISAKKSNH